MSRLTSLVLRPLVLLSLVLTAALLAPPAAAAPPPEPAAVRYTVRLPSPHTHYYEVEATYPQAGPLTVFMPVWTPGSYLVREYARHVERLTAHDPAGRPLPVEKTAKNRWTIDGQTAAPITLRYRVYAFELSVRTNFLGADFGLLNGAATFLAPVGADPRTPYALSVEPPAGWQVHTALPAHPDGAPNHRLAPDLDTLIDSPVLMGPLTTQTFTVAGVDHTLVTAGGAAHGFDPLRAAEDLSKLVDAHRRFWGGLPDYDHYLFLNVLAGGGGGLEHRASTVIMGEPDLMRAPDAYRGWLRLASHEFFHTWNVKRLRPVELGPFDYERENHTRSLWIAEGVTSYFDALLWRRAGLATDDHLLERLSDKIKRLQTTPGRHVRSLELASFDAWIRAYRPDENSVNSDISYYTKGAVVAFLLDARIQRLSGGKRTLDDVMRAAWARYADRAGFTTDAFYALASEIAGHDLSDFFDAAAAGTAELDYAPALAWFGLRFKAPAPPEPGAPISGWLGLRADGADGRLTVNAVPTGTPAAKAGLAPGDELIALDDRRLDPTGWDAARAKYAPGTTGQLLVSRRGTLRRLPVTFGAAPTDTWTLERDPKATAAQQARFARWVGAPAKAK